MGKGDNKGGKGSDKWPSLPDGSKTNNARVLQELKSQRLVLDKLVAQKKQDLNGQGGQASGGKGKGGKPSVKESWDCPCGFHNFGFRNSCRECGKGQKQGPGEQGRTGVAPTSPVRVESQKTEVQEDLAKELTAAKHMLNSARTAPECSAQKTAVLFWEGQVKDLREKERRALPVPNQLKSALDRVAARRRAREAASKAQEELEKQLQEAQRTTQEAKEAEAADIQELERLQQEVANSHPAPMEVGQEGPEAQAMAKKVDTLTILLSKVVAALPAEHSALKQEVQTVLVVAPSTSPPAPAQQQPPQPPDPSLSTFGKASGSGATIRAAPYAGGAGGGKGGSEVPENPPPEER